MKHLVLAFALLITPTLACAQQPPSQIDEAASLPDGYAMVWSDEFETDGLPDESKWAYDTHRNREGWYNNELQYYSGPRAENARVENGMLIIEARRERLDRREFPDWGRQNYTSTRLITNGRAAWTYGYYEIRAKLPCGRGTWPAIWTLGSVHQRGWPGDGEIDIMEHVGHDPGVVHGTVHTGAFNHMRGNHRTATTQVPDVCEQFHRYQMHWTPERITVGIDDRAHYQYVREANSGVDQWPFDKPQFLLLNIAVGGAWGGAEGVDDSIFPVRMEVDYVRVYQRAP